MLKSRSKMQMIDFCVLLLARALKCLHPTGLPGSEPSSSFEGRVGMAGILLQSFPCPPGMVPSQILQRISHWSFFESKMIQDAEMQNQTIQDISFHFRIFLKGVKDRVGYIAPDKALFLQIILLCYTCASLYWLSEHSLEYVFDLMTSI